MPIFILHSTCMKGEKMKLDSNSLSWAIKHLFKENDTDLFPKPLELKAIFDMHDKILDKLKDVDLSNYNWKAARRFVIPKAELSYRIVTQLDPIDSIIFSAIIHQFGALIEAKRPNINEDKVFSYRFLPDTDGILFSNKTAWSDFWQSCLRKSAQYKYIAYLDIADFYNQIYHHVIENQMVRCEFPNQITKSVIKLLESVTQTVSRGVPIGPHAAHLLAEMSIIPIDDSLLLRKWDYCRYADDIVIFCNSEQEAKIIVYQMAEILDKQQRLILQRQKTKIYTSQEFQEISKQMLKDNPINQLEEKITKVITKHTNGDLYARISVDVLTVEEKEVFSKDKIEALIAEYIKDIEPNYPRLRWFYRRLIQIGTTHAIEFSIKNMDKLIPAISDVCHYLIAAADNFDKDWKIIGDDVFNLLEHDLIKSNEFFQITLLNLFVNNTKLNHFNKLLALYKNSSENIKRKIILSAFQMQADSWIRELKEDYPKFDVWNKRAMLMASSVLPAEEREHYLKFIKKRLDSADILESVLIDWALKQK